MKKVILIIATLSFGLAFSQQKECEKQNTIPTNPYHRLDSTNSSEIKTENDNAAFYKNIDSAKASKYKMLNKKPNQQYSELPQNKDSAEFNPKVNK